VHLVDLTSVEPSDRVARTDYSPLAQAARLASFLRSIEGEGPSILVGHSLGAGIAVSAELHRRDRDHAEDSAGLVLVSGAVFPQPLPRYMSLARRRGLGELFLLAPPPRVLMRLGLRGLVADPKTISREQIETYRDPLRDRATRRGVLATARALDLDRARGITSRLSEIRVPTLLIWGEQDRIVPLEMGRRLASAIPKAELITLNDVGHLPPEEAPDRSLEPVLGFLDAF
jgi:pimeloyl-ACP methyl ester carboxylesterase